MNHWTQANISDFVYSISLDFFTQLEARIEESKLQRKEVADNLGVTASAVSQMLNTPPENPELETLVKYARSLGLKVSIVLYDDGDPKNERGPVYSGIFEKSWEALNHPRDLEAVNQVLSRPNLGGFDWIPVSYHADANIWTSNIGQPVYVTSRGYPDYSVGTPVTHSATKKSMYTLLPIESTRVCTQESFTGAGNEFQKIEGIA